MVSIADVGIGVSQALPILSALIAAEPNQTVYIEQPGIHLHPFAQMRLVEAVVAAAVRGVRVIVETHSPTFLLALQVALSEKTPDLTKDKIALYWFSRDEDGSTAVTRAAVSDDGAYGDWPVDFGLITLDLQVRLMNAMDSWESQEGQECC